MRVLIFYTQAGGGHKTAAYLLASHLEGHEVKLVDLGQKNILSRWTYGQLYVILTEKLTWIWVLLTLLWKTNIGQKGSRFIFRLSHTQEIRQSIQEFKPDKIVSTYFFAASTANNIAPNIPAYYFVSEIFGAPNIWFDSDKVDYIVCSPKITKDALIHGIEIERIHEFSVFFKPLGENKIIKFDNLPLKQALIVGGGASLPRGIRLIKLIRRSDLNWQFNIVTGKNKALARRLRRMTIDDPRFVVHEFIDYMPSLIDSADLVIAKAGPAIITEVLTAKKPLLLYHYIWEQEKPNMEYVVNNNLGLYQPNLKKLTRSLNNLESSKEWNSIEANVDEHNFDNSIDEIAKFIAT
jgi:UDP-N-acetylglucosamine:LPS N-acetylglucosamine transferase